MLRNELAKSKDEIFKQKEKVTNLENEIVPLKAHLADTREALAEAKAGKGRAEDDTARAKEKISLQAEDLTTMKDELAQAVPHDTHNRIVGDLQRESSKLQDSVADANKKVAETVQGIPEPSELKGNYEDQPWWASRIDVMDWFVDKMQGDITGGYH